MSEEKHKKESIKKNNNKINKFKKKKESIFLGIKAKMQVVEIVDFNEEIGLSPKEIFILMYHAE